MKHRTALDVDSEKLDAMARKFVGTIREHGWHCTWVGGDENGYPNFTYSTGFLVNRGFPEVLVFALRRKVSHFALSEIWRRIDDGAPPAIGKPIDGIIADFPVYLLPMSQERFRDHLGWNIWFYGRGGFDCLQLVFPSKHNGRFPWEDGFSEDFLAVQPDLTAGDWAADLRRRTMAN